MKEKEGKSVNVNAFRDSAPRNQQVNKNFIAAKQKKIYAKNK